MARLDGTAKARRRRQSIEAMVAVALGVVLFGSRATFGATPGPWVRTEPREPCVAFDPLRTPHFGDLHVHTANSIDAVIFNTLSSPRDAYRFANGERIGLAPYDAAGRPMRTTQLGRPLDFTAVTDHAEGFGAQSVCFLAGLPGYDAPECEAVRQAARSGDPSLVTQAFLSFWVPVVILDTPRLPEAVCGPAPAYADCSARRSLFWMEAQEAAEEFYDRSAACTFTSFVGYEWTGTPGGSNLHRNVIFRNAAVPELPVTYVEEQTPQGLWASLAEQCQGAQPGCDWLAIPHNSNLSGVRGRMFLPENADGSPLSAADAATRAAMEPLVEIYQYKGSSECRPGVDSTDEQCGFELIHQVQNRGDRNPSQPFPRTSFVRNALKEGLLQEEALGANPFRFGIIGSTDTHNASPGNTREDDFPGHSGVNDDTPENGRLRLETSRGDFGSAGLAVVWAEENSRDALFAAMRRRETYGTSGPRHIVRFFAGDYAENMCDDPSLAVAGYRHGAPMGSEIGPIKDDESPVFTVLAMKDPGDPGRTGTPLQRVQIIKGWVDASGAARERVFEVAGSPNNGASVDLETCTPTGRGFDTLCTTWRDPDFDRRQRAFYYARILENPTCRWSTYVCKQAAVDCSNPAALPADLALCCDPTIARTIQERSWTSPIWYRPEALARLDAAVLYGKTPGTDRLELTAELGAGAALDLDAQDLRVVVRDDDDILDVTIPAGSLRGGAMRGVAGLDFVQLTQGGNGPAKLVLRTAPGDLSQAERVDHMIDTEIHLGSLFTATASRLWIYDGSKLATATRERTAGAKRTLPTLRTSSR